MGAPATGTALLILGAFVLPGFVTIILRERTHVVATAQTPFDRLLHALYYSALVYLLGLVVALVAGLDTGDLVDLYHGRESLGLSLLAGVLVGVVGPSLIALVSAWWAASKRVRPWLLERTRISSAHSVHSGWNAMFKRDGAALVRVRTKDGQVLGGWYGADSFAGYTQHSQDLFLVDRWELDEDDWFTQRAPGTLGVWIAADNIASIELYEGPLDEPDEDGAGTGEPEEAGEGQPSAEQEDDRAGA